MQKYLLQKRSSSVDIFILNNFSAKKVAAPRSKCAKEFPILKKWLWYSEKITAARKLTSQKIKL